MGSNPTHSGLVTDRSQLAANNMQSEMTREYSPSAKRTQRSAEGHSDDLVPAVVGAVLISSIFDGGGSDGGSSSSD